MVRTLLLKASTLLVLSSLVAASPPHRGHRDLHGNSRPQAALTAAPQSSNFKSVGVEKRSVDEIYKAAMKERGTLRVSWGGDGAYSYYAPDEIYIKRPWIQCKRARTA